MNPNPFNLGLLTPIAYIPGVGLRTITNNPTVYRSRRAYRAAQFKARHVAEFNKAQQS